MVTIINRDVKTNPNVCNYVGASSAICSIKKEDVVKFLYPFDELRNIGKDTSNMEELKIALENVRSRQRAKIRELKKDTNSGYILISSLTFIGTLIVGAVIFMTIKFLLF